MVNSGRIQEERKNGMIEACLGENDLGMWFKRTGKKRRRCYIAIVHLHSGNG